MVHLDVDGAAFPTFSSSTADRRDPARCRGHVGRALLGRPPGCGRRRRQRRRRRQPDEAAGARRRRLPHGHPLGGVRTDQDGRPRLPVLRRRDHDRAGGRPRRLHRRRRAGSDRRGPLSGWSLVVVYRAPSLPLRNLTVFDGLADVGQNDPQTITISGFRTPVTGAVDARIGLVAYEGDVGSSGDRAIFDGTLLATTAVAGDELLQRHERRQRHARHRPQPGRREHARLRHQELRRARHPRQQRHLGAHRPRQHERALLPRRRDDGDRRVRARLHAVHEDGHQPHRRRPGPRRGPPALHGHVRQRRTGPGDQHVDRRSHPGRDDVRARLADRRAVRRDGHLRRRRQHRSRSPRATSRSGGR